MNPNFDLIGQYKGQIMKCLCDNDEIFNIVSTNRDIETRDQICGYIDTKGEWHDGAILPYLYIPYNVLKPYVFLCFDVTFKQTSNTIQDTQIYITMCCHKSLMQYNSPKYHGSRMDTLLTVVNEQLTNAEDYSIGHLIPAEPKFYSPKNDYYGYAILYSGSDFKDIKHA